MGSGAAMLKILLPLLVMALLLHQPGGMVARRRRWCWQPGHLQGLLQSAVLAGQLCVLGPQCLNVVDGPAQGGRLAQLQCNLLIYSSIILPPIPRWPIPGRSLPRPASPSAG